jgi:3-oxoacyl-[acyl-carrier-protein] synthase-3
MDGPEVFRHAVTKISEVIDATLTQDGYKSSDIDWFLPHQAKKRILDGAARKLGLDPDKIIITVDKHANTSAASIPLALSHGRADGRIKIGDLVLLEAMGGGFTWGAVLLRW